MAKEVKVGKKSRKGGKGKGTKIIPEAMMGKSLSKKSVGKK